VTRKPTSTRCDHVKHPERLGVRGDDAGEAMVAGRSWAWVFVVRTHDAIRGRRLGCGGSSASPRLLLLPDHRSCCYCVVAVFLMESICASIRPSEHAAQSATRQRLCSLQRRFRPTPSELQAILSQTPASPSNVEYKRQTCGPPMRSLTCLNRAGRQSRDGFPGSSPLGKYSRFMPWSIIITQQYDASYGQMSRLAIPQCDAWRVSGHDCMLWRDRAYLLHIFRDLMLCNRRCPWPHG